jgi:parallel beta-helix repeat protein
LTIIHQTSSIATVRYVNKTGTSTPPYTSWQTAADSIQKCISICSFGDTVYVANGVYEEQVVMIPGLSLIGAGMDSCVIDTRSLVQPTDFFAVAVYDSCNLQNLNIIVSNEQMGSGIYAGWGTMEVNSVRVENAVYGINSFNANSIIKNNILLNVEEGIEIEAFTYNYNPIIENNIIYSNGKGVKISIGTKPTIRNNIIFLDDDFAEGIWGGSPDTLWVYNNLVVAEYARNGISNAIVSTCINNFILGKFWYRGITSSNQNIIQNNTLINGIVGITKPSNDNPTIKYNNSWHNDVNYSGFTPDSTNLSVNPMIVNDDTTRGELDFHLQMFSPLIDAGDPSILDKDGSRSDIGLYGGPFGESYKYIDLAPSPPLNLTALVDSNYITLNWNRNTEADTSFYKVYRDTVINFQIDSTKLISSQTDTFFVQFVPQNIEKLVYKVTCVDKQGIESNPSEEKVVVITGIENYPQLITDYQLYQNYPNPFNPSTKISYRLKERGYVKLYVYDIKGELVRVLVNQEQSAGFYQVEFNSSDNQQPTTNNLASGIYIYQILVTGENNTPVFSDIKKMILLK